MNTTFSGVLYAETFDESMANAPAKLANLLQSAKQKPADSEEATNYRASGSAIKGEPPGVF